jgi:hypothetical protein
MTHHAITTVQTFLDLMAARELSQAASYLDNDAIMIFPGGNTFTSLTAFAQWAKSRYQNIDKTIDSFDLIEYSNSTTIVYCYGSLRGNWGNGSPFKNIRFIDRFVITAGRIIRQEVWNDLAEDRLNNE